MLALLDRTRPFRRRLKCFVNYSIKHADEVVVERSSNELLRSSGSRNAAVEPRGKKKYARFENNEFDDTLMAAARACRPCRKQSFALCRTRQVTDPELGPDPKLKTRPESKLSVGSTSELRA
ncbi:hypothetical protein EVAR_15889_1 [Eumeta japonica]|uniref:Uncharacterized protein n=1 Tax=Eumeta variegata TaxID=151549 RepID=A0A4C1UDY2_EUMVA|nr:hypothetical protein EVAR_15889_1 [Eumeta japonica]